MTRALLPLLFACGCRAVAGTPDGTGGPDSATLFDASDHADRAFLPDFEVAPDLGCPPSATEVCNDGCDNDGNGYADAEDPACAPIALAGQAAGDAVRFAFTPGTLAPFLTLAPWSGSIAYRRAVSPDAWVTHEAPSMKLERVDPKTGMATIVESTYYARDVCFFGGNLIVVQPGVSTGTLHQLKPDGTELGTATVAAGVPAACASDGTLLWVPVHTGMARSQLIGFDAQLKPATMRAIPPSLAEDRCLDLAFTVAGPYGLFASSGGVGDVQLSAPQAYPFALDGGVGAPIPLPDGSPNLHSLGEFAP